jgi:hypothetical protein
VVAWQSFGVVLSPAGNRIPEGRIWSAIGRLLSPLFPSSGIGPRLLRRKSLLTKKAGARSKVTTAGAQRRPPGVIKPLTNPEFGPNSKNFLARL